MEKITAYKTSDSKIFEHAEAAVIHQKQLNCYKASLEILTELKSRTGLYVDIEVLEQMALEMSKNPEFVLNALNDSLGNVFISCSENKE